MATGGEFELIGRHFAPLAAGEPGAFGLADDAAVLGPPPPGEALVATCDTMVADVHFIADDPPDLVARKLLRVNLSDLAAMGAAPAACLLSLALPAPVDDDWLAGFARGLAGDLRRFGVALAGGDMTAAPGKPVLTLTALGHVRPERALTRSGAAAGDDVWVSGSIGDACLGLAVLQGRRTAADAGAAAWLAERYRLPQPRLALGRALAGVASAALDVSDGLVADLGHLCAASGVGAEVSLAAVPLSPAARSLTAAGAEPVAGLLAGGDDYELVFAAPAAAADAVAAAARGADVPVTRIGRTTAAAGVRVRGPDGAAVATGAGGWRHFGA